MEYIIKVVATSLLCTYIERCLAEDKLESARLSRSPSRDDDDHHHHPKFSHEDEDFVKVLRNRRQPVASDTDDALLLTSKGRTRRQLDYDVDPDCGRLKGQGNWLRYIKYCI